MASTSPGPNPPGGSATSSILLETFHAPVEAGGAAVKFDLRAAQSCKGSIEGQTTKRFVVSSKSHRRRKLALGPVDFRLLADKTKTVVLSLSAPPGHCSRPRDRSPSASR